MRGLILSLAFVAVIPLSNWFIGNVGTLCVPQGPCLLPVGFGLMAPSGVLFIGAGLVLRDALHRELGLAGVAVAIIIGAMLSFVLASPSIAVASMVAFATGESADTAVYTPLHQGGRPVAAIVFSGIAGAAIDSAVFLVLAFGSLDFLAGQVLGKLYATAAAGLYLAHRQTGEKHGA